MNVLAGSAGGLVNGSLATQGNPENSDAFGTAVATGDFDDGGRRRCGRRGAGRDGERPGDRRRGQRVQRPAERTGLRAAAVPGHGRHPRQPRRLEDRFGFAVAPTDSNGIGQWDLAVGVPYEDVGPDVDTGVVNLLAGSATGPSGGSLLLQGNPEDFDVLRRRHRRRVLPARLRHQRLLRPGRGRPVEKVGHAAAAGAVSVFNASGGGRPSPPGRPSPRGAAGSAAPPGRPTSSGSPWSSPGGGAAGPGVALPGDQPRPPDQVSPFRRSGTARSPSLLGDQPRPPEPGVAVPAVPAPRVRHRLDGELRLQHRHLDGDGRHRGLRHPGHRPGGLDGHGGRPHLRADGAAGAVRGRARRPLRPPPLPGRRDPVPDAAGGRAHPAGRHRPAVGGRRGHDRAAGRVRLRRGHAGRSRP